MNDVTLFGSSPFDAIRRTDEAGGPTLRGETYARADLHRLPATGRRAPEGRIYVVEFSNAIIKVGRTANPQRRIATHSATAEPMGVHVDRVWLSEVHANFEANERGLIQFGQSARGEQIRSEYFANGPSFSDFVTFAGRLPAEQLDFVAWKAEQEAKVPLFGNLTGLASPGTVVVSRAYFEAAERWMVLTNSVGPDGNPRAPLAPVDRCSYDECVEWAEQLALATGQSVEDIFEMSWIDMVASALESKVATAVLEWRLFAIQHDRSDMTRSCYEAWSQS